MSIAGLGIAKQPASATLLRTPTYFLQLLATSRACPLDRTPLQHDKVEQYKPNYSIMIIVATARDPAQGYQVPCDRLEVDVSLSGYLGQGGSGKVYRGALLVHDSSDTDHEREAWCWLARAVLHASKPLVGLVITPALYNARQRWLLNVCALSTTTFDDHLRTQAR